MTAGTPGRRRITRCSAAWWSNPGWPIQSGRDDMPVPRLPTLPPDTEQEISTTRLKLTPMRESHARIMYPLLADASLHEYTGGIPPSSIEALAAIYLVRESRMSRDGAELWLNWMIWHPRLQEAIGYTQATVYPTHAEVAWVVGRLWQGQGFASEAAAAMVAWLLALGLSDIRACVHPQHTASRRVAQKAGLRLTDRIVDGEQVWAYRAP